MQGKPDVRLKSHFEALLSGENISSRPEGQRERERRERGRERERERERAWGRPPGCSLPSGRPQISM